MTTHNSKKKRINKQKRKKRQGRNTKQESLAKQIMDELIHAEQLSACANIVLAKYKPAHHIAGYRLTHCPATIEDFLPQIDMQDPFKRNKAQIRMDGISSDDEPEAFTAMFGISLFTTPEHAENKVRKWVKKAGKKRGRKEAEGLYNAYRYIVELNLSGSDGRVEEPDEEGHFNLLRSKSFDYLTAMNKSFGANGYKEVTIDEWT